LRPIARSAQTAPAAKSSAGYDRAVRGVSQAFSVINERTTILAVFAHSCQKICAAPPSTSIGSGRGKCTKAHRSKPWHPLARGNEEITDRHQPSPRSGARKYTVSGPAIAMRSPVSLRDTHGTQARTRTGRSIP
jgi:hypothetical protein